MRDVALRVPPIGRLYKFAMQQAQENQERASIIETLTVKHGISVHGRTIADDPRQSPIDITAQGSKRPIRSNVAFWKELQDANYFETHPCYNGLVDMGDGECRVIEWFVPLSKDMQVVVIGCGYGRETAHIAPKVSHVYGIDVSPTILTKAVRYLGDKGITNFTPIEAEHYRQTIPKNIDLVFSIVVMQHLTRDLVRDYFEGLATLLKPEGRMVIQFLESLGAYRQTEAELRTYEPAVSWTVPEIVELCRGAGLKMDLARTHLAVETALWHWISVVRAD